MLGKFVNHIVKETGLKVDCFVGFFQPPEENLSIIEIKLYC